jgi:hypothetical protein
MILLRRSPFPIVGRRRLELQPLKHHNVRQTIQIPTTQTQTPIPIPNPNAISSITMITTNINKTITTTITTTNTTTMDVVVVVAMLQTPRLTRPRRWLHLRPLVSLCGVLYQTNLLAPVRRPSRDMDKEIRDGQKLVGLGLHFDVARQLEF